MNHHAVGFAFWNVGIAPPIGRNMSRVLSRNLSLTFSLCMLQENNEGFLVSDFIVDNLADQDGTVRGHGERVHAPWKSFGRAIQRTVI